MSRAALTVHFHRDETLRNLERTAEALGVSIDELAEVAIERELAAVGARLPTPCEKAEPAYLRYPLWVGDPVALTKAVASRAVLGGWFTSIIGEALDREELGYRTGSCPNAELANGHVVNLPTHPRVNNSDIEAIVAAVKESCGSRRSEADVVSPESRLRA
jgi:dTDP-4-amino-4,6-dideoxygalactose transaminase